MDILCVGCNKFFILNDQRRWFDGCILLVTCTECALHFILNAKHKEQIMKYIWRMENLVYGDLYLNFLSAKIIPELTQIHPRMIRIEVFPEDRSRTRTNRLHTISMFFE